MKLQPRDLAERAFLGVTQNPALSRITGRLADAELPQGLLIRAMKSYIKAYNVDMSEGEEELNAFRTFNAFFTRKLVDGARPIAHAWHCYHQLTPHSPYPASVRAPCDTSSGVKAWTWSSGSTDFSVRRISRYVSPV